MKIDKLHLLDFGQFHNKDIELEDGINVVYGPNEAGKSTVKDFIVDMLYGIEKSKGLGARFDHYEQKKPINGSAFAGAMEVSTEDNHYLVERNFSRQEKKTVVRELISGRELQLSEANSLQGSLIQTDKSTYMNTLCMGQMSAATDEVIAERLNHYIVNMASTKTGDIDALGAIARLKEKRKTFSNKELEARENELTAQLGLERDFDAELAAIKKEYDEVEALMQGKDIDVTTDGALTGEIEDGLSRRMSNNSNALEQKTEEQIFADAVEEVERAAKVRAAAEEKEAAKQAAAAQEEKQAEEKSETEEKEEPVLDKKAEKKAAKAAKKAKKNGVSEDTNEEQTPLTEREKQLEALRNMGKKSILDNTFVILFLSLVCMAFFVGVAYVIPVSVAEVKLGIIGFGVALVLITTIQVLNKRAKLHKLMEELEIERNFEEAKANIKEDVDSQVVSDVKTEAEVKVEAEKKKVFETRQMELVNRMSDLKVKEERILNERANQEQVLVELNKVRETKAVNDVELAALDLAIKTIQDLSEEIYDSFGNILNEQVSKIVSQITNNKYSEVKIDEQLNVMVKTGNSFISMEYLSTGTMEQIYLALRLAIANVLIEEELPIIIDDSFVTYDEQRLRETLHCLGEYFNRQIIIFTANPRIQEMFSGLGVQSNYVTL